MVFDPEKLSFLESDSLVLAIPLLITGFPCENVNTGKSWFQYREWVSSLLLEVFPDEVMGGTLLAPVTDHQGGAPDNLPLFALRVQFDKDAVISQLNVVMYSQDGNLISTAQSFNLDVRISGCTASLPLTLGYSQRDKHLDICVDMYTASCGCFYVELCRHVIPP